VVVTAPAQPEDRFILDGELGEPEGFSLPTGESVPFVGRSPADALPAVQQQERKETGKS